MRFHINSSLYIFKYNPSSTRKWERLVNLRFWKFSGEENVGRKMDDHEEGSCVAAILMNAMLCIHIQCNPYQSANDIFPRIRPNNSKTCMKPRKTSYRQNNFKQEQSWRYFAPGFDLWHKAIVTETVQCWHRIT